MYDGVPLTERDELLGRRLTPRPDHDLPRPHAAHVRGPASEVRREVTVTVVHEIAHHFGIDDHRLHELGWG